MQLLKTSISLIIVAITCTACITTTFKSHKKIGTYNYGLEQYDVYSAVDEDDLIKYRLLFPKGVRPVRNGRNWIAVCKESDGLEECNKWFGKRARDQKRQQKSDSDSDDGSSMY
ncbi:hypothetical protein [Lentilitoribacter sp. Alg239-R112]|jgi:hypothetical protein|uniref:hypothetical protein n=1 Tax=Lentilitoribacter sp. Alg239-R112 TaxID=2305987 RepID=UPI0013A6B735|nr:hypothetical protein [Lentilitoribacter sp. Alg239-R112]